MTERNKIKMALEMEGMHWNYKKCNEIFKKKNEKMEEKECNNCRKRQEGFYMNCDHCKKWICEECLKATEKLTKNKCKEITKMTEIPNETTNEANPQLIWACKECSRKERQRKKTGGKKSDKEGQKDPPKEGTEEVEDKENK